MLFVSIHFFKAMLPEDVTLREKLFSSLGSPTTFDESFKVIDEPFFIPDFNFLSCELDKFTVKVLYRVILYWYFVKIKQIHNTFTAPCEKSNTISFASSIKKKLLYYHLYFDLDLDFP